MDDSDFGRRVDDGGEGGNDAATVGLVQLKLLTVVTDESDRA